MAWSLKREIINEDTGLSKITATRTDAVTEETQMFAVKACMITEEEQAKVWAEIYRQYRAKVDKATVQAGDAVCAAGTTALEAMEAK